MATAAATASQTVRALRPSLRMTMTLRPALAPCRLGRPGRAGRPLLGLPVNRRSSAAVRAAVQASGASSETVAQADPAGAPSNSNNGAIPGGDGGGGDGGGSVTQLGLYVAGAAAFGGVIALTMGGDKASEYFAGYLLEQSLSVDNLVVFVLIFSYFQVPPAVQKKALTYGIWGAVVFRAIMIGLGVAAIEAFEPVLLLFAAILLFTSYKLLTQAEEEDEDLADNAVVKLCRRLLPVSDSYDGDRFFTTLADGARLATPLLLCTAVVELSDVLFAVDSIPAVFGVTHDPFIVYTSNMAAILSLRALYSFVSGKLGELRYLEPAVAIVLGFIGLKMIGGVLGYELPTAASLGVVAVVLGGGVGLSLALPETKEEV